MRASLVLAGVVLLASACAEPVASPPDSASSGLPQLAAYPPHVLSWRAQPQSLAFQLDDGDSTALPQAPAQAAPGVIPLQSYQASFWVGNHRTTRLGIDYDGDLQPGRRPFLRLTVPPGSLDLWPDGRRFGPWDWVQVTVRVDSTQLVVHFSPTGLRFVPACPVLLELWYGGAGGDYDGDGDVDQDDARIEPDLHLWHQVEKDGPWAPLWSYHSVRGHYFMAPICGFSSYAISF